MSTRVEKITVSNLKAISEQTADFKGCTAIITGGNNKGKTSFLRSLPDRIHGVKPDLILKQGEAEGYAEWLLTTGEKFVWNFNDGKGKTKATEKLTFITDKGVKGSLTREIALKYFPPVFDVDNFLAAQPKRQKEILQKLVGLDFTDVDKRYEDAYLEREGKNRRAKEQEIIFTDMAMPEEVKQVSLDELMLEKAAIRNKLNVTYLDNKKKNEDARKEWERECEIERRVIEEWNSIQRARKDRSKQANEYMVGLVGLGYTGSEVLEFVQGIVDSVEDEREYAPLAEPTYIKEMPDDSELKIVDEKILTATKINQQAQAYSDWKKQQGKMVDSAAEALEADGAVKKIEEEKMEMIRSAKMPIGFGFDTDGILFNNLPFTREQQSSSGLYIAALKLAAMTLGEVRTLHFDASFLDKISLGEIEKWANDEDLQLLIERPDYNAGEIHYELINQTL